MPEIEHVIVLALENRSFDHLLGYLDHPDPGFNGLLRGGPFNNPGWAGQAPTSASPDAKTVLPLDPDHSHDAVLEQLGLTDRTATEPTNQGFIASYERKGRGQSVARYGGLLGGVFNWFARRKATNAPRIENRGPLIMHCQPPSSVPVLSTLAKQFAVCTHWHASVPGETWPNRNFLHAATSNGETNINPGFYDNKTIFELLEGVNRSWHIYHDDTPQIWAFINLWDTPERHANWFAIAEFERHVQANQLPTYSFIEPNQRPPVHLMDDGASTGADVSNSQHPGNNLVSNKAYDTFPAASPGDFTRAEQLVAYVYETLRANTALFQKSLLLITYDEHGGLFDHVPPPTNAPAPKLSRSLFTQLTWLLYHPSARAFDFRMLGVRVPAIVVSPHIQAGAISDEVRDHASVPSTLRALFAPHADPLTARDHWAPPFHTLATLDQARTDLPNLSAYASPPTGPPAAVSPLPTQTPGTSPVTPQHYEPFTKLTKKVRRKLTRKGVSRHDIPRRAPTLTQAQQVSQAFMRKADEARQVPRG